MQNLKHFVPLKMKHFFIIAVRGRLMLLIQENVTWTTTKKIWLQYWIKDCRGNSVDLCNSIKNIFIIDNRIALCNEFSWLQQANQNIQVLYGRGVATGAPGCAGATHSGSWHT